MKKKPVRKKTAKPARDNDAERGIFTFTVSGKLHRVDPLEVLMALRGHSTFDLEKDPIAASSADADGVSAMQRTMAAVSDAFGVGGITEGGMTVAERMQLLLSFLEWCDVQKKSSEPSPTSLPTSAPHQDELPGPRSSDSTSTANESCSGEASQSALEPVNL